MSSLYLKDATLVDWPGGEPRRGQLKVDRGAGGGVSFVGAVPEGAEWLDCAGRLVTRSFVNGHQHIYSALARGMPGPAHPPRNFVELLERVWWRLDKALDRDMIVACAQVAALDALRCGCTCVIDHHSSPRAARGSLGAVAGTLDQIGLGHLLCYELSDRDGPESLAAGWEESVEHLASRQGLVGLHASFTVSDELLARAVSLAAEHGTGIHIHVAEDRADQRQCVEQHGKRVVERLAQAGALELPATLLAHCLHLDSGERELLAESPAWVVQNCESNQNNGVGHFDRRGLDGERLMLGTDGMHGDLLASARAAYLEGQATGGLSPAQAWQRLRGAQRYLACNDFACHGENDLVVLDYDPPTPVTRENWPAHGVYGLASRHVHSVIRQGRVLLHAGRFTELDEAAIMAHAREQAARLWSRL